MIGAVVLAAGEGRRLGGVAKALLRDGEASFLARIAATAAAAGVAPVVVVVGPPHEAATAAEAARLGLAIVRNPTPERGMASSIATGFAAGPLAGATAALLWPVDHARVTAATVAAVVARATEAAWVVPCRGGAGGHPVAVGRALWPALIDGADAPGGARAVRDRLARPIVRFEVDDPAVLADVDRPEDLAGGAA
jgi:CTP:molybdopterin cytidylyltransferase MocA